MLLSTLGVPPSVGKTQARVLPTSAFTIKCQVCTKERGGCGSLKADRLMHSFPLPGAPGAGQPSCSRVCSGQHRSIPTPGSPWTVGVHRGRQKGVLGDSWAFFQHLFQCLCTAGATVQCQPHAPSPAASATQLWGVKPDSCPHPGSLSLATAVKLAKAAFPAGRREAGRAGKAAGTVRRPGCEGWSSCGPSRCQSWAAGPR